VGLGFGHGLSRIVEVPCRTCDADLYGARYDRSRGAD